MEINSLSSKKIIYSVLAVVCIAVLYAGIVFRPQSPAEQGGTSPSVRTEYNNALPPNIPEVVAPKSTEGITQSYLLDYVDQGVKQSTVVVSLEKKTPTEVFKEYETVLRGGGWVILNTFETPNLASLYVAKDSQEINITIKENDDHKGSILSISALNK